MMDSVAIGLTQADIVGRIFRFGGDPGRTLIAQRVRFLPDGTLYGHRHPNEARWRIDDGHLVLLNLENRPSCRFDFINRTHNGLSLSGRFLLVENGPLHHLDEVVLGNLGAIPDTLEFLGEFGEEVNHFIPFVYWLHRTGYLARRKVDTYAGMEPFYFFLPREQIVFRRRDREYLNPHAAPLYYLHPTGLEANRSGMEWAPDYRATYRTDFGFSKPILVVHNKYTEEWGRPPVNFLDSATLTKIFTDLKQRYQIVFFEAARPADLDRGYSADRQGLIRSDDVEIARSHPEVLIFGDLLRQTTEPYNLLKLRIFSSCRHFITVQGGNAHLCALFPGSLVAIQHFAGPEEDWAYANGTFQFLSNPRPTYLIGRNGAALREITAAFKDCEEVGDSVHLGAAGIALYQRYNPAVWRSATVPNDDTPAKDGSRVDNPRLDDSVPRTPLPAWSAVARLLRRFRAR